MIMTRTSRVILIMKMAKDDGDFGDDDDDKKDVDVYDDKCNNNNEL